MRKIYLIRHAHPQQGDKKRCISRTDIPLDDYGRHQARQLAKWGKDKNLRAIYTSPLARCSETAGILSAGRLPVFVRENLREMDVGLWENLTFEAVREKFPEDYAKRGTHPGTIPPAGGESMAEAGVRLLHCIQSLLSGNEGDIAVVTHGGAIRGLLCRLTDRDPDDVFSFPQPWGCVNELQEGERIDAVSIGCMPDSVPGTADIDYLFRKYKTPEAIRRHGQAVADCALMLALQIGTCKADIALLQAAGILHDLLRPLGECHAQKGGEALRVEGYPKIASLIEQHHDLPESACLEAQLLYLADKLVKGTKKVSLEARFEASLQKCTSEEARKVWQKRYCDALAILKRHQLRTGADSHETNQN